MLTKWAIANFKSVADRVDFNLAPLTLLVGPNSSGKSTIIQSILLVAQTLSSRRSEPQLLLNGEFVRLGVLDDLLHVHTSSNGAPFKKKPYLEIGFELQPTDKQPAPSSAADYRPVMIRAAVRFENRRAGDAHSKDRYPAVVRFDLNVQYLGTDQQNPQASKSALRVTARKSTTNIPHSLFDQEIVKHTDVSMRPRMAGRYAGALTAGRFSSPIRISSRHTEYAWRVRRQTAAVVPIGARLRRFLPTHLTALYDKQETELRDYIDQFLMLLVRPTNEPSLSRSGQAEIVRFVNTYLGTIKEFNVSLDRFNSWFKRLGIGSRRRLHFALSHFREEWLQKRLCECEPQWSTATVAIPEPFDTAIATILEFFSRDIKYLGPLREEPRLVYSPPFSGDPTDVGLKGEYTAAVLTGNKNVQVSYYDPRTEDVVEASLTEAVGHWLRRFGLADSVATREVAKLGHGLVLEDRNIPISLDLTNVGVGVSQVLPILVSGLLAKAGSVLIYEQPEIHLHPRLQAEVADFFLGLIYCQKRCILETHSEYLVGRIRRRLAEAQNEDILSKVRILFSEKPDSVSTFREVAINKYGAITEWPQGFFDQAQEEAQLIIEASMLKRFQEQHG